MKIFVIVKMNNEQTMFLIKLFVTLHVMKILTYDSRRNGDEPNCRILMRLFLRRTLVQQNFY